jgi:hypothetical protein
VVAVLVKRKVLVLDDYDMGGVWACLWPESEEQIRREFPQFTALKETPNFTTWEKLALVAEQRTLDIDDRNDRFLKALRQERRSR